MGTTYYLLLTIYYLLITTYYLLLTTYYLLLTTHYLLLTTYYSLLTTYYLLLTTYYLLLTPDKLSGNWAVLVAFSRFSWNLNFVRNSRNCASVDKCSKQLEPTRPRGR